MTLPVNTVFPTYNNTTNFSGVNASTRSAGLVANAEQAEAVAGAERDGRLGLSEFAFLKIPREVLFLQDEKGAKLKSPNVASSTKSDFDQDRLLSKVEDAQHAVKSVTDDSKDDADLGGDNAPPGGNQSPPDNPYKDPHDHVDLPSGILGSGPAVYQGVISANGASLSGRNVSVLA